MQQIHPHQRCGIRRQNQTTRRNHRQQKRLNNFKIAKNFTLSEFESPDTGEVKISSHMVFLLQRLRDKINAPIISLSGYRTPEHNKKIGGAVNSLHMQGMAADITCRVLTAVNLALRARIAGFPGIICYVRHNFIHVDIRDKRLFKFIK